MQNIKLLLQKKAVQITLLAAGTIAIVYGMIYMDVVSRAKEAYMEGEKFSSWDANPAEKQKFLDAELQKTLEGLKKDLDKKKITQEQYDDKTDIAKFDYERNMKESSIKYAYIWYQTVVELFTPPESSWVKLAREKMPIAKEKWKAELRAKKIPFEDYMLE